MNFSCENRSSLLVLSVFILAAMLLTIACGGYSAESAPPPSPAAGAAAALVSSMSISPSNVSLASGSKLTFAAGVQGSTTDTAVTWTAALGAINAAGVYTAPASAGSDTVTATSHADPTKAITAKVTVTAASSTTPTAPVNSVTVSPTAATIKANITFQFSASVIGTATDKSVTWKTSLGTISSTGVYTPPTITGAHTVTATSKADPTKSATATVTVMPVPTAPVTGVSISPLSPSVTVNTTQQFSAAVLGTTTNKTVTWKATKGQITSAGVYTAPATAGTDTVTATSAADATKSSSTSVTVVATAATVSSVAVSPDPASSLTSGTLQFAATVNGTTTDKTVTWKASRGTITTTGGYTAPTTAGSDTVTATSHADITKSDTAAVTVAAPVVSSVAITPATVSMAPSSSMQFNATVAGSVANKTVTWKASRGTVNTAGMYTAPSTTGSDIVTATSVADTTKSAPATVTVSAPTPPSGPRAAFPGAQGGGAQSAGGRGGKVMEVTNLQDSGTGSLRACVEASGARTCVFRVAGIIHPKTHMKASSPFLTIAGQTAPGSGIVLQGDAIGNDALLFISTHDVTVRYLTCSIGKGGGHSPGNSGATCFEVVSGGGIKNVVFDHLTARWWDNKPYVLISNSGSGFGPVTNTVFQWSLVYEPNSAHPVGPMVDDTGGFGGSDTDHDFHHNLFANIGHRLPLFNVRSGRWVNNIVFNWEFYALLAQGGVRMDIINNKYVPANLNSGNTEHEFDFNNSQSDDLPSGTLPGPPSAYIKGNVGPHQSSPTGDQTLMTRQGTEGGDSGSAVPSSWFRSSPLTAEAIPIVPDPETSLDSVILPTVGNSQMVDCSGKWVNRRDAADTRIVAQYQNRASGSYFTVSDATHAISPISSGIACASSAHDGLPDQWKAAHGFSASDTTVANKVASNGYTYLENYLSGIN